MATEVVTRPVSAEQWVRALDRALEEAIDILVEPLSGQAFCESATEPGTLYIVTASSCSCRAGTRGLACKHRAAYLFQIDEFPADVVVVPLDTIRCSACAGVGKIEAWGVSGPIGCKPCDVCDGSGLARDHRLTGQPAVEVVATAA